ncbi:hypothetical protein [Kribbella italica]|uniref:Uncharacterized protein n=1 Tax=Kribbella italica TaxID=1540520 RepID=A0A7W9JEB1_9ACTN|nr:hypothetical protein [Kribbella italica]MBB5840574.1 hypothetical protein [Kribbella italica]
MGSSFIPDQSFASPSPDPGGFGGADVFEPRVGLGVAAAGWICCSADDPA